MLAQLLYQILDWLFGFLTLALLARFLMQWVRAPFRNPLGQFVVAITDWAVKPARRLIPSAYVSSPRDWKRSWSWRSAAT